MSKTLVQRLTMDGKRDQLDQVSLILHWIGEKFRACMERMRQARALLAGGPGEEEEAPPVPAPRSLFTLVFARAVELCKSSCTAGAVATASSSNSSDAAREGDDRGESPSPSPARSGYQQAILLLEGLLHSPEDDFCLGDGERIAVERLLAQLYGMLL